MTTTHKILFRNSKKMSASPDGSVHLVVTSPPYPMISMWDEMFAGMNTRIKALLEKGKGGEAFELMHRELDKVWKEVHRVLCDGGIACINIGDAVRTLNDNFQLYSSHARILQSCAEIGFSALPAIIWRKQTNAPNKFMGSGMLPPGAYVTLEHEYILILRKGGKRQFVSSEDKRSRAESAFFWEERNNWFSDVWFDLKGTGQKISDKSARGRTGEYPFELAYRLVNMFSVRGDTILDPFLGTATTTAAAMASERNSIGYEMEKSLEREIRQKLKSIVRTANARIGKRFDDHAEFVAKRTESGKAFSKTNRRYDFPCVSGQETRLAINYLTKVAEKRPWEFEVSYKDAPPPAGPEEDAPPRNQKKRRKPPRPIEQQMLPFEF